jgi:hypothetical protein
MTCSEEEEEQQEPQEKILWNHLVEFLGDDNFLDDSKFMMCTGGKSALTLCTCNERGC